MVTNYSKATKKESSENDRTLNFAIDGVDYTAKVVDIKLKHEIVDDDDPYVLKAIKLFRGDEQIFMSSPKRYLEDSEAMEDFITMVHKYCHENNVDVKDGYYVTIDFEADEYKKVDDEGDIFEVGLKKLNSYFMPLKRIDKIIRPIKFVNNLKNLSIMDNGGIRFSNFPRYNLNRKENKISLNEFVSFIRPDMTEFDKIYDGYGVIVEDYDTAVKTANKLLDICIKNSEYASDVYKQRAEKFKEYENR